MLRPNWTTAILRQCARIIGVGLLALAILVWKILIKMMLMNLVGLAFRAPPLIVTIEDRALIKAITCNARKWIINIWRDKKNLTRSFRILIFSLSLSLSWYLTKRCTGNYYGAQCEVDGEVMGVAIGASVGALIIIVLTLVCLVMWR